MADDTQLGAPVGVGDVISTDDLGTKKVQRVKVQHGADGSATDASTASPLPVDQTNTTVADGGALPAKGVQVGGTDGSVFQVLSTDNAGRLNANINGTVPVSGPLTDTQLRATPVPVSGTVTASGPLTDTQLRATPVPISGTVTANGAVTNAGTFAVQDSQKVADNAAFTDGTTPVQPAGYVFDEVAGTALTENDAAAARVDSKRAQVLVIEDETTRGRRTTVTAANALKVDGSAVTQPVSGTVTANLAAAAGATGLSKFHLVSAATTNATNVKASAGKLHGWYIYNSNAAARKVAFHNTASSPTAGTGVTDSIVIPPTSAANAFTDIGVAFSTGIAITTVTDLTDAGTTAVAANDLIINLYYV